MRVALRFLISAIKSWVLRHFLSMNLITHPSVINWRSNYKINPMSISWNCVSFIIRTPTASFKGADTIYKVHIWALLKVLHLLNNYSPSITSFDIITMLIALSKNTCVNVFSMRTRPKRYIKLLTGESIRLHLWISNLKICKPPFKFTWNAPLSN